LAPELGLLPVVLLAVLQCGGGDPHAARCRHPGAPIRTPSTFLKRFARWSVVVVVMVVLVMVLVLLLPPPGLRGCDRVSRAVVDGMRDGMTVIKRVREHPQPVYI
jgi:hypothetical protein